MSPEYAANITQALFEHGKYAAEQVAEAWSVDAILEFERGREVTPTSRAALFASVRKHIRQIGASQERGDFPYPELFEALLKGDPDEHNRAELPIQKWVAANLQLVSRGIYTIERETELANENEVDISATIPGVGRVPLEIKPIGKYSLNALKGTIENQLLAKYMVPREVTHGVLLLVQLEEKHYEVGGNRQGSFSDMVRALSEFAAGFTVTHGKSIAVETISVVKRVPNNPDAVRVL